MIKRQIAQILNDDKIDCHLYLLCLPKIKDTLW